MVTWSNQFFLFVIFQQVNNLPVNILPVAYTGQSHGQSSYSSDDLPKTVVMSLPQGSTVRSMDFHPVQQILLLGQLPLAQNIFLFSFRILLLNSVAQWMLDIAVFFFLLSFLFLMCCFFILVGTNMGDIMVWDLGSRERLAIKNFKLWELASCSMALQVWFLILHFLSENHA